MYTIISLNHRRYAALARGDADMLYNIAVAGGYKSKHMNKEVPKPSTPDPTATFTATYTGPRHIHRHIHRTPAATFTATCASSPHLCTERGTELSAPAEALSARRVAAQVIVKLLRFGNDTMGRDLLGDKNAAQFMDDLKAQDPYAAPWSVVHSSSCPSHS